MIRYIDSKKMGRSQLGWLDSHFHFSFAEYYNPENINFGVLRVVNDDLVQPDTGFDMHSHKNMEIISYVVSGELSHADSLGNEQTLGRGQVQYMSAGSGVVHSEHNWGKEILRFFQIWILPDQGGYTPNYGDYRFAWDDRIGRWLPLAASVNNERSQAPIKMHADVNVYATFLADGQPADFRVPPGRQAYLVVIEGGADVNGQKMGQRDALEVVEENLVIRSGQSAHLLIIEMAKS